MQNRYVGDIGDFGKFGLLKALCQPDGGGEKLTLGVVWYLVPDESHNNDGKHINYLRPTADNFRKFRSCDPMLYDKLSQIVQDGNRDVKHIREDGVLLSDTVYYERELSYHGLPNNSSAARENRLAYRTEWVKGALETTGKCDIVFVDPDNGLGVSVERHQAKGPKYVYYDELQPYLEREQSLIIYHHIGRNGTAGKQIQTRFLEIKDQLNVSNNVFALLFGRGSLRAYFVVPGKAHADSVLEKARRLITQPWGSHFALVYPNCKSMTPLQLNNNLLF